jgi:two-component system, response regulator FlrC
VTLAAASTLPSAAADGSPIALSPAMREVMEAASDVAPTPTTVLLLGESGTGKEMVARLIHAQSRRPGPWVAVNCAALPAELLESELFGHEKGAFTGASERHTGRFELAQRGTLLLDEVSELPLPLQAKLLRVLQEREVDRVGGHRPVPLDVRVIATSNRDLAEMVQRGLFRSDLYYRLNVFPIVLPPLRERAEDLPGLTAALVAETSRGLGRPAPRVDEAALEALRSQPFHGNVRELRNMLERALVRCRGPVLGLGHLSVAIVPSASACPRPISIATSYAAPTRTPTSISTATPTSLATAEPTLTFPGSLPLDLGELERLAITEALRRVRGNRTHAARLLGIGLRTLRNKLRAYRGAGLDVEAAGPAAGQLWPAPSPCHDPSIPQPCPAALRARASQGEGA